MFGNFVLPYPSPLLDIDECATGDSNCHRGAICKNTIGSFYCTCGVVNGEHFEGNGTHCEGKLK